MPFCIVSQRPSARMFRLKELVKEITNDQVYYLLVSKYIDLSCLEGMNKVILSTPFGAETWKCITEQIPKEKLIIDISTEHALLPITDYGITLTAFNKETLDQISSDEENWNIILGLTNCYKQDIFPKRNNSIAVDFNYVNPVDLLEIPKHYTVHGFSYGLLGSVQEFKDCTFQRAIVCQEPEDLWLYSDCEYVLYTKADNNEDIVIPDTMIDFLLMGVKVIITSNLEAAQSFLRTNNCGISIGRDQIKHFEHLVEQPVKELETMLFEKDISQMTKILEIV